jgi:fatty acid desaturase
LASDADPDRHKHACVNKWTRARFIGYLMAITTVVRSVGHVFLPGARTVVEPSSHGPRHRYRLRDVALLAGWQLGLFAFLTWLFGWWAYLVLWWVPVFLFMFLPDNLRTFVEHSQPEGDAAADTHRLVTNRPGWLERQFLSPMNMNYHAAHHLWPSIPYYNLPIADAEMRTSRAAEAISWRGSYLAYLRCYYRLLPLQDCQPSPTSA